MVTALFYMFVVILKKNINEINFQHILELLEISPVAYSGGVKIKCLHEILIELLNIVETKVYTTPPSSFDARVNVYIISQSVC